MQVRNQIKILIVIFIIAFMDVLILARLYDRPKKLASIPLSSLERYIEVEALAEFQVPGKALEEIKKYCQDEGLDFIEFFSAYMMYNGFKITDVTYDMGEDYYNNVQYPEAIKQVYKMLLSDVKCFPIPKEKQEQEIPYYYANSWKADRTYGGDRPHYGTDLMDVLNENGRIPIVSMTDGVVEKIGWLELGGWRIGIRAEHGGYFYYAHMDRYAKDMTIGRKVKAGDILGYMGDTGYGEEVTRGKFPVHLHLGIALPANENREEFWINPYWLLSYVEEMRVLIE